MSYYTGPHEEALIPLRLMVAARGSIPAPMRYTPLLGPQSSQPTRRRHRKPSI